MFKLASGKFSRTIFLADLIVTVQLSLDRINRIAKIIDHLEYTPPVVSLKGSLQIYMWRVLWERK